MLNNKKRMPLFMAAFARLSNRLSGRLGGPQPSKYNPNPATCAADSGLAKQGFLTPFPAREAQRAKRETVQTFGKERRRRAFPKHGRMPLLTAAFAIALILFIIWGNVTVGTTRYTLVSDRLPPSFDHFKIVSLSDVHNAEFGKDNSALVELVKAEQPDMIAITGDLVDSAETNLRVTANFLHALAQIAPCYYVAGNHEAWLGGKYPELEALLLDASVVILRDRAVQWERNGEVLQIAGLYDPDFTDSDPVVQQGILEEKLRRMRLTDDYCVLLSHRPEAFDAYVSAGIDLALSGHAHGGQFRLPLIGGLIAPHQGLFPAYDAGVYEAQGTAMVVSRGIGNSVIPVRINNRPEVVSVELLCGG